MRNPPFPEMFNFMSTEAFVLTPLTPLTPITPLTPELSPFLILIHDFLQGRLFANYPDDVAFLEGVGRRNFGKTLQAFF